VRFAYPVMLDVTDRLVVVVGGGAVAVRKIRMLLEAGAARVRVVAPCFHEQVPAEVERVQETYEARHLDGSGLVFAATDSPDVNDQVVRDARARGVLVNRLDEGSPPGDFVTPAVSRKGEVVLALAAGSPALSAAIRDDLAARLDARHVRMSQVMVDLRPRIRGGALDAKQRAAIFRDLATDAALDALAQHGERGLHAWLAQRYPELKLD
jgi:precorrin-2 dehydrogenase / sirohydrochlorin ferrochelatase